MTIDILTLAGTFTALSVAINWLIVWANKVKSPHENLEKRMDEAERKIKEHDDLINKASLRINSLEKENRIILKSLLALLSHSLDGNDIDKMKASKQEIENYLLDK